MRLSANTDTSVTPLASFSATNVPTIERPPTSSGSAAATRLRKNSTDSRNRIGNASISARARSCADLLVHVAAGRGEAAELHAVAVQLVAEALGGVLLDVVVRGLEVHGDNCERPSLDTCARSRES